MSHFLLVYDRLSGDLELTEYGEDQAALAMHDRFEREVRERSHPEVEVVVLGAPSLEALKRTHARYFKSVVELAQDGVGSLSS
jgi:hypothetical protein